MLFTIMNSFKKTLLLSALVALFVAAFTSCREDSIFSPEPSEEGMAGGITFRCSDMLETFVGENNPAGTRAAASKNPEEKAINTLHVFFFDYETGALLETEEYDNFNSYQKVSNTNFIKIPTGEGVSETFKNNFKSVHIVAIANIDATDEAADYTGDANKFYTKYSTDGRIQKAGRDAGGEVHEIDNYSKLKEWIYYPRIRMNEDGSGDISKLPDAGMPMIGELGNKDLDQKAVDLSERPANTIMVNLTALMAKVNVSVKLDPDQYTDDYPLLKITGYGVRNMPVAVPFEQPDGKTRDGSKPTKPEGGSDDLKHADYFAKYNVTDVPMFHKGDNTSGSSHFICPDEAHEFLTTASVMINKDSEAVTFSYYTFENINLPDYNAKRANGDNAFDADLNPVYPDKVKDIDKQRWKSTFAYSDRASAMILKGEYTNHQGMTYKAQFTVYMGRTVGEDNPDPNIDFMVKRNHQYDNNIVIHGLDYIRNSDDEVYNFDGRVNVVDDNPLYLAIVNERKVDAHATALPMDVWFMFREDGGGNGKELPSFDHNSTVTVTIPNDCNWVRMMMIPRKEMEDAGFAPGTGIEDYFYDDMLARLDDKNKPLLANHYPGADCGQSVTITCTPDLNNSRSRIYFYIDENVPKDNNGTNYTDRKVKVQIKYETNKEGVRNRDMEIEIEQRALYRVVADGEVSWMEVYEEYLDHDDPLDPHNEYGEYYKDGLPWGLDNNVNVYNDFTNPECVGNTALTRRESYQVYTKIGAFAMSRWAILRSDTDPVSAVKLFNEVKPSSAFHYCMGKNKRLSDGSASYEFTETKYGGSVTGNQAKGWYMPGIRELEKALTEYYNEFSDFRGNYYWSASCAEKSDHYPESNTNDYARATRIIFDGNNTDYAKSHPRHKEKEHWYDTKPTVEVPAGPGHQKRDVKNRIRAFYRVD